MDSTWLLIIGGILLLAAFMYFSRSRPKPHGTYEDEDVRSSGSIGGGPAYDDEDVRSSGSIGGDEEKAYDDPDHRSGGSIGG